MTEKNKIFPLLIAEVANCHGGSQEYLSELIDKLCATSIEAVKFQLIIASELLTPMHSRFNLFKSFEFDYPFWKKVVAKTKAVKKKVIFDIFGEDSLTLAIKLNADMLKIYASDIDDVVFIKKALSFRIPIFLSTGGATLDEIDEVVKICKGANICLLVGFQSYPTPIKESHINRIAFLRSRYGCKVGYMDHSSSQDTFSIILPCIAVARGACTVEKHVYLDNREKKYDWESAISPQDIDRLHLLLLKTIESLGDGTFKLTALEKKYFSEKRKVAVAARDLKLNERLNVFDLLFRWTDLGKGQDYIYRKDLNRFSKKLINCAVNKYEALTKGMFK